MSSITDERVLLPSSVTPSHYSLTLVPDLVALTFSCEEEIRVTVSSSTCEVKLHSKEISVVSASFKGVDGEELSLNEMSYHLIDTTVTLKFSG